MSKPEWGTKRTCLSCGARFYDFGKSTLECPACGASFDLETIARTRRTRGGTRTVEPKAAVAKAVVEEEEVLDEVEEEVEDEVEEDDEDEIDVVDDDDDEAIAGGKKKRRRKVIDEPVVEEDDEEEESLIEDASELGDDDMSDVIEKDTDDDPS